MPNPASKDKFEEQLENEIGRLREIAVKSSDPLVVAKAIAVSHDGVQQLVLNRLRSGERFVEVFALQGTAAHELQVFCRFLPANKDVHLVDSGFLVFVDPLKGEVIGTVDPFVLQPERRVGRPFVTVSALNSAPIDVSNRATNLLIEREQAFFRSLGLSSSPGSGTDTCCETGATSVTWSGQPYRPDQTDPEATCDYCDSSA